MDLPLEGNLKCKTPVYLVLGFSFLICGNGLDDVVVAQANQFIILVPLSLDILQPDLES